ncbi:MAG: hypothetical protein M3R04_05885 [bacterium]|nr:hypothetical protein [bacterium]
MVRITLLVLVFVTTAVAVFKLEALGLGLGTKQQPAGALKKEETLGVIASAAAIDMRQPQHIKTATFALG